jgi:predicted MFS family arabinose efflux permease
LDKQITLEKNSLLLWLAIASLSLGPAISNGFSRFAYGLILPAMREDLSWTYTEAGWFNTVNAVGYLIGALLTLATVKRFPPGRLFLVGMLITGIGLLLSAFTRDFWFLTLWRVVAGAGGAPAFITGGVIASGLFKDRPTVNALAILAYFGGGGLGMLSSGIYIPLWLEAQGAAAWPATWFWLGIVALCCFLPSWWAVNYISAPLPMPMGQAAERLPVKAMWPSLANYSLFAFGYIIYITFLVAWMRQEGFDAKMVVLIWSVMSIAVIISPLAWRTVFAKSQAGMAGALTCSANGVGALLPVIWPTTLGLLVSAFIFGISIFQVPGSMTNFSRKNLPQSQWGASVALFTTLFAGAQVFGPLVAGWVSDLVGDLGPGLLVAAVILLLGGAVALFQKPISAD